MEMTHIYNVYVIVCTCVRMLFRFVLIFYNLRVHVSITWMYLSFLAMLYVCVKRLSVTAIANCLLMSPIILMTYKTDAQAACFIAPSDIILVGTIKSLIKEMARRCSYLLIRDIFNKFQMFVCNFDICSDFFVEHVLRYWNITGLKSSRRL